MANLILKRFKCNVDTNESGADSPYFLTFVGDLGTGKATVKRTAQGNWHDEVDQGETWTVNETVASGFDLSPGDTLVLSIMIEEDTGYDVTASEAHGSIRNTMKNAVNDLKGSPLNDTVIGALTTTFRNAVKGALLSHVGADDDLMPKVRRVKLKPGAGELDPVSFIGGGGNYSVRYAKA